MIALLISLAFVSPLCFLCFRLGQEWERQKPAPAERFLCELRHPSHHHRRSMTKRRRQTHLRLVAGVYDWEAE